MVSIKQHIAIWLFCAVWFAGVPALADEGGDIAALEAAVEASQRDGDAWTQLGQAYLKAGRLDDAERAFQQGVRHANAAAAYHGLGQVYMNTPGKAQQALYQFRRALGVDPTRVEAQLDIARLYIRLQNVAAEPAMRKATEIAPAYAPAHWMLAEWYRERAHYADAVEAYRVYLTLRPDDGDGYEGLALSYAALQQYESVVEIAYAMREQYPDETRWVGLIAQAHAAWGDVERALALFEEYMGRIASEERALYDDLSLVAPPNEEKAYRELSDDEVREAFLERFWKQRDPMVVFGGKARQVEHYRRVWYARTYFSRGEQPWDRRGEIYIRYGEPDYRSYSYRENALPSLSVRSIKERNAFALYESGGIEPTQVDVPLERIPMDVDGQGVDMDVLSRAQPRPLFGIEQPQRAEGEAAGEGGGARRMGIVDMPPGWIWFVRESDRPNPRIMLNKPPDVRAGRFIEPVFPLERQIDGSPAAPWESWVYVHVGEGIEFVFVNPYGTEAWEFPFVPVAVARTGFYTRVAEYDPGVVHQRLASEAPEFFGVPPGMEPLAFFYDMASFRGDEGKARLEVYFGIPMDEVALLESGDRRLLDVEWVVALVDSLGNDVVRNREERVFEGTASRVEQGEFVLDIASLDVMPGKYRLGVWLSDPGSGKWGSYLQEVEIPAYGDSLTMSDLAMSYRVSQEPAAELFRKGDVWVIPMPNRNYRQNQGIFVYYEVYHLQRDAFNQTRYRVEYAIRQDIRIRGGMLHAMAGMLNRLFADRRPEVTVSYEREGSASWEPMYLEVTPEQLKAGWNQISVTVTDLNAGRSVSRSAIFQLEPVREAFESEPVRAVSGQVR